MVVGDVEMLGRDMAVVHTRDGSDADGRAGVDQSGQLRSSNVILWLNGTFGAGKTTVSREILARGSGWRLFDPEWIGYMLRENLRDLDVTDFQDLPPWRSLTPRVLSEVHDFTRSDIVAPQTVLSESYWVELRHGMVADGLDVVHVVLDCDDETLRQRIENDRVESAARQWRIDHIEKSIAARPWLVAEADFVVDTTHLTPEDAAHLILGEVSASGG